MSNRVRNIRLLVQYEGTRYQGWQKQTTSDQTIQGKLETLLTKMCGKETEVIGSGRTDAGVHAIGQVANFFTDSEMTCDEMITYINQYLPEDIAVVSAVDAAPRFHSRLNAVGKCYRYMVNTAKTPNVFYRRYALEHPEKLDLDAIERAAKLLIGEHDFKAFTSAKKSKKSTVRRIDQIEIRKGEEGQEGMLSFYFEGNGFLHHMVRILMGTLLEVGEGLRTPESVLEVLEKQDRSMAGRLVPAKGLMLMKVFYSSEEHFL